MSELCSCAHQMERVSGHVSSRKHLTILSVAFSSSPFGSSRHFCSSSNELGCDLQGRSSPVSPQVSFLWNYWWCERSGFLPTFGFPSCLMADREGVLLPVIFVLTVVTSELIAVKESFSSWLLLILLVRIADREGVHLPAIFPLGVAA